MVNEKKLYLMVTTKIVFAEKMCGRKKL